MTNPPAGSHPTRYLAACLVALSAACGATNAPPDAAPRDADPPRADARLDAPPPPPPDTLAPDAPEFDAPVEPDASPDLDATTAPDARDATSPTDGAAPAVPSAGCASGTGLPEGPATITVGGMTRNYVVRLPAGYTRARPWPLVLALHPNGSNTTYWDGTGATRPLRRVLRDHAVLVLPQARSGDWRGDLPTDLAYFDALIERVKTQVCVDTSRIFSMGFSGGGSFSGVLGCRRRDIRAIAAGGAVTYFEPADCVGLPAAWITIGAMELVTARAEFRDFWRTRNACMTTSAAVPPPPCVAYAGCAAGRPTHYCQHPAGHEWPAFGTEAAWAFFSRF